MRSIRDGEGLGIRGVGVGPGCRVPMSSSSQLSDPHTVTPKRPSATSRNLVKGGGDHASAAKQLSRSFSSCEEYSHKQRAQELRQ